MLPPCVRAPVAKDFRTAGSKRRSRFRRSPTRDGDISSTFAGSRHAPRRLVADTAVQTRKPTTFIRVELSAASMFMDPTSRPDSAQIESHRLAGEFLAPALRVDSTHTSSELALAAEPVAELAEL